MSDFYNNSTGIIIKVNMNGATPTSITYLRANMPSTAVTDGCYSRAGATKTYDFITYDGNTGYYNQFMRVNANFSSNPPMVYKKVNNGNISSVSWDGSQHIVGGNKHYDVMNSLSFVGTFNGNTGMTGSTSFYELTPSGGSTFHAAGVDLSLQYP